MTPHVEASALLLRPQGRVVKRHMPAGDPDVTLWSHSVLKPLWLWAGHRLDPSRHWTRELYRAVVSADDAPVTRIWERFGQDAVLDTVAELTGIRFDAPQAGRFTTVPVSSAQLVSAYLQLAQTAHAGDAVADRVLHAMAAADEWSTFGATGAVCDVLRIDPFRVSGKAGWGPATDDATTLVTHAVVIARRPGDETDVVAVTTRLPLPHERLRRTYLARVSEEADRTPAMETHWVLAGPLVAQTVREMLLPSGRT